MKRLTCIALALLLPLMWATGQDVKSKQSQKARLEKEIASIEQQLKETSSKNSSALDRLSLVRNKVAARQAIVKENEKELAVINDSINVRVREINKLKARLDTMTLYYDKLVKNAYKNRDSRVWYMYLLSSGNIGQASRRFGYLRSLSTQMSGQARKIQETKSQMETDMERLKQTRERSKSVMASHQKELAALKAEQAQAEKLVSQLKNQKSKYQKELVRKREQVGALNKEISKVIGSQVNGTGAKKGKTTDVKLSGEFEANIGKLPWPCEGTVTGHFGKRTHPVYKSLQLPFNNGIDLGVVKGTKAKAVFDGEVKKIIAMPGYNKCVLVQHGSYFTFYCKLGSVDVKAGDKIKTGQEIGTVDTIDGNTQLHFQLWAGTTPQDPEIWLRER